MSDMSKRFFGQSTCTLKIKIYTESFEFEKIFQAMNNNFGEDEQKCYSIFHKEEKLFQVEVKLLDNFKKKSFRKLQEIRGKFIYCGK
jgi:hypothetical protein